MHFRAEDAEREARDDRCIKLTALSTFSPSDSFIHRGPCRQLC